MSSNSTRFAARRDGFAESLRGGIAVIPAGGETVRNNDVNHEFRQNSDFWFLTGFQEPDAIAMIDPTHHEERYVLFVRPSDRELEIWNGHRAGVQGAKEIFGADAAYPIADLNKELYRRLVGREAVYTPLADSTFTAKILAAMERIRGVANRFGRAVPIEVHDTAPLLHELRLRKTPDDVAGLRRACEVSALGHAEAMRFAAPGMYEYQVQAAMEYVFRANGSTRNGYPSIVASGHNACVLHYTENDQRIDDGDLLLIDAGAEFDYFSADITRTFPVAGRFTGPQRAIYDVVLAASRAAFEVCLPGTTMKAIHERSVRLVSEGLVELGLLPGPVDRVLGMHHYREYFMHGTGHWLGLDVHDVGAYGVDGKPRLLEPGMSFTVEPGVYVDPHREATRLSMLEYHVDEWTERRMMLGLEAARKLEADEREAAGWMEHPVSEDLKGIGVRIEDDVLLTEDGYENLTSMVPTDPDAIENLCAEASALPPL